MAPAQISRVFPDSDIDYFRVGRSTPELYLFSILMKQFLFKCALFVGPFVLLYLLSFEYDSMEGGLIRMSYKQSLRKYSPTLSRTEQTDRCCPIFFRTDKTRKSIAIFGDSFIRNHDGPPFWQGLPADYNVACFRQQDFTNKNPFSLALSMHDTLLDIFGGEPDFIFVETIERSLLDRTNTARVDDSIKQKPIQRIESQNVDFIQKTRIGINVLSARLNIPYAESQRKVHQWHARGIPSFLPNQLLTYRDDFNKRRTSYESSTINRNLKKVISDLRIVYPNSDIQLLIIPDKLTAYEHFLVDPPEKQSVLDYLNWEDPSLKIRLDQVLQKNIEEGSFEVYTYAGTHFGVEGSRICEDEIRRYLNVQN